MSIAGYEAFVCVCFFVYKTLCAALHMASVWDARSCPYVFILREKNYYINYCNKNEKHFKNEQKVGMLLQKRADSRGVVIT